MYLGRIDLSSQSDLVNLLVTPAALPARSLEELTNMFSSIPFAQFFVQCRRTEHAGDEELFARKGGCWEIGFDSCGNGFVNSGVESSNARDESFLSGG